MYRQTMKGEKQPNNLMKCIHNGEHFTFLSSFSEAILISQD